MIPLNCLTRHVSGYLQTKGVLHIKKTSNSLLGFIFNVGCGFLHLKLLMLPIFFSGVLDL
jgi:hypothetical protein